MKWLSTHYYKSSFHLRFNFKLNLKVHLFHDFISKYLITFYLLPNWFSAKGATLWHLKSKVCFWELTVFENSSWNKVQRRNQNGCWTTYWRRKVSKKGKSLKYCWFYQTRNLNSFLQLLKILFWQFQIFNHSLKQCLWNLSFIRF